jgi:hypothetical protein
MWWHKLILVYVYMQVCLYVCMDMYLFIYEYMVVRVCAYKYIQTYGWKDEREDIRMDICI